MAMKHGRVTSSECWAASCSGGGGRAGARVDDHVGRSRQCGRQPRPLVVGCSPAPTRDQPHLVADCHSQTREFDGARRRRSQPVEQLPGPMARPIPRLSRNRLRDRRASPGRNVRDPTPMRRQPPWCRFRPSQPNKESRDYPQRTSATNWGKPRRNLSTPIPHANARRDLVQVTSPAEVSGHLVGSTAFKAAETSDPRLAGSIPVHLRQTDVWSVWVHPGGRRTLHTDLVECLGAPRWASDTPL